MEEVKYIDSHQEDELARERVLRSPELLLCIFEIVNARGTLPHAARVCQAWFPTASRVLWRVVRKEALLALFSLLGKLSTPEGTEMTAFAYPPVSDSWSRFSVYSGYVQYLDEEDSFIAPSLLHDASLIASSNNASLFPNLQQVEYYLDEWEDLPAFQHLLSDCVTQMRLWLSASMIPHSAAVLRLLGARAPLVRILDLGAMPEPWPVDDANVLAEAFSSMSYLQHFRAPSWILTRLPVWTKLGAMPRIESIQGWPSDVHTYPLDMEEQADFVSTKSFTMLRSLEMIVRPLGAMRLLSHPFPQSLHQLSLGLIEFNSSSVVENILTTLTHRVSHLTKLALNLESTFQLPFTTFSALIHLSTLKNLHIVTSQPLLITSDDLLSLVQALPTLSNLDLVYIPAESPTSSALTFQAVEHVARYCPNIESLCIYIDSKEFASATPTNNAYPIFHHLKHLSFGYTQVATEDQFPLALWIGGICPDPLIHITYGTPESCIGHSLDWRRTSRQRELRTLEKSNAALRETWETIIKMVVQCRAHDRRMSQV